jgi:hypothetical protein
MKKLLFLFALLAGMALFVPPAAADPPDGVDVQHVTTVDHADLAPDVLVLAAVPVGIPVSAAVFLPQIPDAVVADLADAIAPRFARPPDLWLRQSCNDQYLSSDKNISFVGSGSLRLDPG